MSTSSSRIALRGPGPRAASSSRPCGKTRNVLVKTMEQLVERQAGVWGKSMEKADRLFNETGRQQQEMMSASLIDALEVTMTSHTQALAEMEKRMLARSQEVFTGIAERTQSMYDGLSALATVLRETGRRIRPR